MKKNQDKPVYRSFLYLVPSGIGAAEMAEKCDMVPPKALEVWTEVNVLEIATDNGTITFEDIVDSLGTADMEYLSSISISKVYACDYQQKDAPVVRKVMNRFLAEFGGKIGSDTEDFQPYLNPEQL